MPLTVLQEHKVHGGTLSYRRHTSLATGTPMRFSLFLPPGDGPFPLLVWLSGLTCTEDNFTTKAGAYAAAAAHGIAIAAPDTSPRGEGVADDPAYDLGQGAGFYVDATQAPWSDHFKMETYVVRDLLQAVEGAAPVDPARRGIFGHSMGGHGALSLALRHPETFGSVSAFAPIASPTRCEWGRKAFSAYLGADEGEWARHDAARLIEAGAAKARFDDILVDQGEADSFLETQLKPELLEAACAQAGQKLTLRRQAGYDHSYFFIASFVADHIAWHAARLKGGR
ncbi:MAG: S-formylglutathione hydrolase [Phenylobacterium sp.]|uniref:S-formylglutathione hydrolase n=1 Tax=Phenylobacterium sp. TaxID=1871053 RepID=UPI00391A7DA9